MAYEAIETCINATADDLGFEKCQRNPDLITEAEDELAHARNALMLLEKVCGALHVGCHLELLQDFATCPDALCKSAREAIGK